MRESLIYQEIIQQGVQQGLRQGLQQGKREEALSYTMRLLTRRLGVVAPQLQAKIQELTITQLEELGEALLDFTDARDLIAKVAAPPAVDRCTGRVGGAASLPPLYPPDHVTTPVQASPRSTLQHPAV